MREKESKWKRESYMESRKLIFMIENFSLYIAHYSWDSTIKLLPIHGWAFLVQNGKVKRNVMMIVLLFLMMRAEGRVNISPLSNIIRVYLFTFSLPFTHPVSEMFG